MRFTLLSLLYAALSISTPASGVHHLRHIRQQTHLGHHNALTHDLTVMNIDVAMDGPIEAKRQTPTTAEQQIATDAAIAKYEAEKVKYKHGALLIETEAGVGGTTEWASNADQWNILPIANEIWSNYGYFFNPVIRPANGQGGDPGHFVRIDHIGARHFFNADARLNFAVAAFSTTGAFNLASYQIVGRMLNLLVPHFTIPDNRREQCALYLRTTHYQCDYRMATTVGGVRRTFNTRTVISADGATVITFHPV